MSVKRFTLGPEETRIGINLGSNPPASPLGIFLSDTTLNENLDTSAANLSVASLVAVDPDSVDTHLFDLVTGNGDADNARFVISGANLYLKQGETLDHESQPEYQIRIQQPTRQA